MTFRVADSRDGGSVSAPAIGNEPDSSDADVGQRLRTIRQLKRHTLKTVAERAGVSQSFLSQVERGRARTSIGSLKRIAAALDLSMADLFGPDDLSRPRVLKPEDRPGLAFGHLGRKFLLTPRPLQFLEVFTGELEPSGSTGEAYAHGDSEEFFIVLAGRVRLELAGEVFHMERGDSIDYRSSVKHRLTNPYDENAEVMWVISPPSY